MTQPAEIDYTSPELNEAGVRAAAGSPPVPPPTGATPAPAAAPPVLRNPTPAPGAAGAPGAAPPMALEQMGNALYAQGLSGSPARPVGLSAADKQLLGAKQEEAQALQENTIDAIAAQREAMSGFARNSEALADQAKAATNAFQKQNEENARRRAALDKEALDSQTRIDRRLAEMEAAGVNPNAYFENMSTPAKIAAAFAIGVGQFAATYGPHATGVNAALNIINGAVNQEIDAQKVNLQRNMELLKMRSQGARDQLADRIATLNAERESMQTAYSVAMNDVTKRLGMYKDNATVQQNGQQLISALKTEAIGRTGQYNDQIHALMKGAEKVVGGGPNVGEQLRKRAIDIRNEAAKGGRDITPEEARRQAIADITGVDVKPGEPMASYAKVGPAAKGEADKQAVLNQLQTLGSRLQSTSLWDAPGKAVGSHFQGTEGQTADLARKAWNAAVVGMVHKVSGQRGEAAIKQAEAFSMGANDTQETMAKKVDSAMTFARGASSGGGAEDNPAGLEKDEEK